MLNERSTVVVGQPLRGVQQGVHRVVCNSAIEWTVQVDIRMEPPRHCVMRYDALIRLAELERLQVYLRHINSSHIMFLPRLVKFYKYVFSLCVDACKFWYRFNNLRSCVVE